MTRKFDIKPGDLIEWVYAYDNELVVEDEELWSRIEKRYVPIGRNLVHLCISVENSVYSWLNEKGLFRAHMNDTQTFRYGYLPPGIVPRTRKII